MTVDRSALRRSWDEVLAAVGVVDDGLFDEVVARYGEDHRRYHGVAHGAAVVGRAQRLAEAEGLDDARAVLLAA